MPTNVIARGKRLYVQLKSEAGEWFRKRTEFVVGQERQARTYAEKSQKIIDARRAAGEAAPANTCATYATRWTAERRVRGLAVAEPDLTRLRTYVMPTLGSMLLRDVRPKHVRDLIRSLRALRDDNGNAKLAPRTIVDIYGSLHGMFASAEVDELVESNPVKLKRGELPKKRDKDPTWRSQATYTVHEVERLISDPRIPVARRIQYACKAIAGMRHGEVAALRWRFVDTTAEPLGRLNIVASYCSKTRKVKSTKTGETRTVPIHATLAQLLASWRLEHWPRVYGRQPTEDDLVVLSANMTPVNVADANHRMREDFELLGLRAEAGAFRKRGGHDLRSWYQTRCIEDGADSLIIRRTTHSSDKSVNGGYERFSWAAICREVAKLKVAILDGKLLELGTSLGTRETAVAKRWEKTRRISPYNGRAQQDSNGSSSDPTARDGAATPGNDSQSARASEPSRTHAVPDHGPATWLDEIEAAIRAGDSARALAIVAEVRAAVAVAPPVLAAVP